MPAVILSEKVLILRIQILHSQIRRTSNKKRTQDKPIAALQYSSNSFILYCGGGTPPP